MKYKSYFKYKDSGVQWIGEIPEGWNTNKIKHNVLPLEKSGLEASEGNEEGIYPFFTSSQIQSKFIDKAIFDNECLILGTGGTACVHYIKGKFSASTDCLVLKKQKNINMKFLWYQILSNIGAIDDLGFWGMGLRHIQKDFFNNMLAYWPDRKQQENIINFLDSKTSQLSKTIAADKKLIELLKEKRTALINHVVTKGLNPKAKMRDSGIKWIGKVLEEWEVKKLKYSCLINKKTLGEETSNQLQINYLDISNVNNMGSIVSTDELYFEDAPSRARRVPEQKDTIISTVRTYLKAIAYLDKVPLNLIVSTGFAVLHPNNKTMPKYLFYMTSSENFIQKVIADSTGVAYPAINPSDLGQIKIFLPPYSEQIQISEYLDKATSKIDQTIQNIEKKIELLEEYKKSLIHHVVTGKVDVRDISVW